MPMVSVSRTVVTDLRERAAQLKALGVPTTAIAAAMQRSGAVLETEARVLAPSKSGAMVGTLKTNKSVSSLKVTIGNNTTVKYALNPHARAIGRSNGMFTMTVPAHTRAGYPVRAYKRLQALRDYPFMFIAAHNKGPQVVLDYVDEMKKLYASVLNTDLNNG